MTQHKFKPKNDFWRQRTTVDAMAIFNKVDGSNDLYNACVEYFKWIADNPLESEKVGFSKGKVQRAIVTHPHAMTIWGISSFIGITSRTWYEWRKNRPDLKAVIEWAEEIIKQQKFSGAAAGLLNANIISRELGLADKHIQETVVPKMTVNPPAGEAPPEPPIFGE